MNDINRLFRYILTVIILILCMVIGVYICFYFWTSIFKGLKMIFDMVLN